MGNEAKIDSDRAYLILTGIGVIKFYISNSPHYIFCDFFSANYYDKPLRGDLIQSWEDFKSILCYQGLLGRTVIYAIMIPGNGIHTWITFKEFLTYINKHFKANLE